MHVVINIINQNTQNFIQNCSILMSIIIIIQVLMIVWIIVLLIIQKIIHPEIDHIDALIIKIQSLIFAKRTNQ